MSVEIKNRDGSTMIVNNPSDVDAIIEADRKFEKRCKEFHETMMRIGVKAYRVNDGWIDRQNHRITFFRGDKRHGYYWGNLNLAMGDLIFIGDAHSNDGRFAVIDGIVEQYTRWTEYKYQLIEIKEEDKGMKSKLKAIWRILRAKEWVYITDKSNGGYVNDWSFMGAMPKKAKAEEYADLVLKLSARMTAVMKLTADKIFKAYHRGSDADTILTEIDVRTFLVNHNIEALKWNDGEIEQIKIKE